MSDFTVTRSWIDKQCGDGVHHIVRCLYKIARYNISDSIEGDIGGLCGDFWTPNANSFVSFANLVNNGGESGFVTYYGGTFYSEKLNIANNTDISLVFLNTCADYTEFRECCIFRATARPDKGTCTMIDCLINFEHAGAVITETTFEPFLFDRDCPFGRSHHFTEHEHSRISCCLKIAILLIAHIGITNAQ